MGLCPSISSTRMPRRRRKANLMRRKVSTTCSHDVELNSALGLVSCLHNIQEWVTYQRRIFMRWSGLAARQASAFMHAVLGAIEQRLPFNRVLRLNMHASMISYLVGLAMLLGFVATRGPHTPSSPSKQ